MSRAVLGPPNSASMKARIVRVGPRCRLSGDGRNKVQRETSCTKDDALRPALYCRSRTSGIEAENAVNGTIRGPQKVMSATQHPDGTLDAVVKIPYTYRDGKVMTTTLTIVNNDVSKSEDKVMTPGETK